ncbi:MAG: phosphopyruvate hydratase, partial [Candidatus Nanoarchaeia archaeon]
MDGTILAMRAREILDSRGNPTVEVDIRTEKGCVRAAVPSGASTGTHEAVELRDGGKRYNGKGVKKAVDNVNNLIARKLVGEPLNQRHIDRLLLDMDGTYEKKKLGANTLLAVSMAACKAEALAAGIPLYKHIHTLTENKMCIPTPCFNIINGGAHAGNDLSFQEYMLIPHKANSFSH